MTRLIGVVHLPALPGSPRARLTVAECITAGVRDARALSEGGADGVIIENFHDVPFRSERADAHTVAAMTTAAVAIRDAVACEIGINVLRNDAAAALGIALACGGSFVRVNVHTGAMLTDQGIVTGRADETLRLRRSLGAEQIAIYADVLVKHAVSLGPLTLEDAIHDTVERGLADAIVVSGRATGLATSLDDVRVALEASSVPVYIGSGITLESVASLPDGVAGVIVGTSLKRDGRVGNPVDITRVQRLRAALDERDRAGR